MVMDTEQARNCRGGMSRSLPEEPCQAPQKITQSLSLRVGAPAVPAP